MVTEKNIVVGLHSCLWSEVGPDGRDLVPGNKGIQFSKLFFVQVVTVPSPNQSEREGYNDIVVNK
jgi:hypothetical protein